jgi:uncharacterized protein YjbI with pentapeptide repeats
LNGGGSFLVENAALIGAGVALTGVLIAQLVNTTIARNARSTQQELEDRRARAATLQAYLEQMGKLLTDKNLHEADLGDNLSTVAQAQTLAILEWSDSIRRRIVLQFLYNSRLIQGDAPVISLVGANLQGADLSGINLSGAELIGVNFRGADLSKANLMEADLTGADAGDADLSEAILSGAILSWTNLRGVKGLVQNQINMALADETTKLPDGVKPRQRRKPWNELSEAEKNERRKTADEALAASLAALPARSELPPEMRQVRQRPWWRRLFGG